MRALRLVLWSLFWLLAFNAVAQVEPMSTKAYKPEIFNGVPADPRTKIYMVALLQEGFEFPGGFMCGASIVADGWVLTAAHCLYDKNCNKLDFTALYALGGDKPLGPGLLRMSVTAVRPHPNFRCMPVADMIATFKAGQAIPMGNDIGLVRVDGVKVPVPALVIASDGSATSGQLVVSGWGTLGNSGALSSELNSVSLVTVATSTCAQSWSPSTLSTDQLCVAPPKLGPLAGICSGDSGGPLVATVGLTQVQVGVVSLGHLVCSVVDRPSLFTNVLTHRIWIESVVGKGKLAAAGPSCTPAAMAAGIC